MSKRKNTFTRIGGSTYKCVGCGRMTRNTGVQALGSELCPDCYEIAGYDNMVNDDGRYATDAEWQGISQHIQNIAAKGGDVKAVMGWNNYLWEDGKRREAPKPQAVKEPKKSKTTTREQWLNKMLHDHIAPLLARHGATVPADCKVSVGFPGGGSARKRIGECWPRSRSSVGVNEIFLNPTVKSVTLLVEVLIHEAIHAADDCKSGHKGFFRKTALGVGLEGKMTATHAGPVLREWIESKIDAMGPMPYGSLDLDGRKKKATYMVKVVCMDCGYTLRTTQKWIDVGLPTCCCGGDMGAC